MKTRNVVIAALAFLNTASALNAQAGTPTDGGPAWRGVQQVLGGKGTMQPGDVLKFSFPRTDLSVKVDNITIRPGFALGSWLAFKRMPAKNAAHANANAHANTASDQTLVMGDLVLLESEVNPVMLALQNAGVEQTALHNHVLRETPHIMYMHIMGHGDAVKIAQAVRDALGHSQTPMPPQLDANTMVAPAAPAPVPMDIDTAGIHRVLGFAGKANGGVYQVAVPRLEKITENGMEIPPSMGLATALNFQPAGNGTAAINGDFVMTSREVNRVIKALKSNNIDVVAIHSHLLNESPRLLFMHFWAVDDAVKLAGGLRAALDQMNVARATAR